MRDFSGHSNYKADKQNQCDCQARILFLQLHPQFVNFLVDLLLHFSLVSGFLQQRLLGHTRLLAPILPLSDVGVEHVQIRFELTMLAMQLLEHLLAERFLLVGFEGLDRAPCRRLNAASVRLLIFQPDAERVIELSAHVRLSLQVVLLLSHLFLKALEICLRQMLSLFDFSQNFIRLLNLILDLGLLALELFSLLLKIFVCEFTGLKSLLSDISDGFVTFQHVEMLLKQSLRGGQTGVQILRLHF